MEHGPAQRNGTTYFEGEYAATSTNSSDIYGLPQNGRLLWPTMEGMLCSSSWRMRAAILMCGGQRRRARRRS